jgi:hypothetical protein
MKENSLNDGAKRNRLLYLKIMYTQVKKILCLQVKVCNKFGDFLLHFWEGFFLWYTGKSLQ